MPVDKNRELPFMCLVLTLDGEKDLHIGPFSTVEKARQFYIERFHDPHMPLNFRAYQYSSPEDWDWSEEESV